MVVGVSAPGAAIVARESLCGDSSLAFCSARRRLLGRLGAATVATTVSGSFSIAHNRYDYSDTVDDDDDDDTKILLY